jgi:hypothetical protein
MGSLTYFVRVFVIGLGFMGGFWIAVAVNPEAVMTNAFAEAAKSILAGSEILIWLVPIVALVTSVALAFATGGWLRLLAVVIAFIGGVVFMKYTVAALVIVGVAIIIGLVVPTKS